MRNKILIVQNSHEGPGIIIDVLKEKQILYEIIRLDNGDLIPKDLNYAAIFILGGPDSANDQSNKMLNELGSIKDAINNNIPIFGVCLGCQILVKLTKNGKVLSGEKPEIGLRDPSGNLFQVRLTEVGKSDPLFSGIEREFNVFELHGEVIDIPKEITLLGEGRFVKNQIIKVSNNSYGFLCHIEVKLDELKNWFLVDKMFDLIDKEALVKEFEVMEDEYHHVGKKILRNYLEIIGCN